MLNKLNTSQKILVYACLIVLAVVILFPIYYMLVTSTKSIRDIYRVASLLPVNPSLKNYAELINDRGFLLNIRNSLIVAGAATIISVFISTLAAYSLVRLKYRGSTWIGRLILFSYLTPA